MMRSRHFPPGRPCAPGFSLLEMLVVLLVLAILGILADEKWNGSERHRAMLRCQGNLQKISLALNIYKMDNNGAFPFLPGAANPSAPLSLLIPKSTTTTEIFICPGSKDEPLPEAQSFATREISYAYYMGRKADDSPNQAIVTDAQVNAAPKLKGQQMFSPDGRRPGNNHGKDGGNILSWGGAVAFSSAVAPRDFTFPSSVRLLNPP